MRLFLFFLFTAISFSIFSQEINANRKVYNVKRTQIPPKIDADLTDMVWDKTDVAKDFVQYKPDFGKKEDPNKKTEVRMSYDDEGIYVAAYLYDDEPDKIFREFRTRDNFGNVDFFIFSINPYDDGINQFRFIVTSSGTQVDALVSSSGFDISWNANWESAVKITDEGWFAELKIPYSALRFPRQKVQKWGINFYRIFRRTRTQYSWNPVNPEIGSFTRYDGMLEGIKDINPPVRLSFYPFISGNIKDDIHDTNFSWTAGMDLKYGINESFTLDATIIPDFGQEAFDDVTLNLGPFEQIYSEKRAFFTEGKDFFTKGDLFNSRRIGNTPTGRSLIDLEPNEKIKDNPDNVDILNIVKISGRTGKGLGIGFLNGITKKTFAIVQDTLTGNKRKIVTEPYANYNVLVLDQQFNKNSSISLVNTNVIRSGHFRDANVTSLLYDLKTKDSKYGIQGGFSLSQIFEIEKPELGKQVDISVGKKSGNHRADIGLKFVDDKYNKNDLGYQRKNNFLKFEGEYSYQIFKPLGEFNKFRFISLFSMNYLYKLDSGWASYQEKSDKYINTKVGVKFFAFTRKLLIVGGNITTGIGNNYDYYEPHVKGRFYKSNPDFSSNFKMSTDYSKKFAVDLNMNFGFVYNDTNKKFGFGVSPRYRFNDNFTLMYGFNYGIDLGKKGFVTVNNDDIVFGKRNSFSLENKLTGSYFFNTKSALALSLRHFWSPVTYDDFYNLNLDGTLSNSMYNFNEDINFNTWNLNLKYNWEFAPGSQLIVFYQNSIFKIENRAEKNIINNLENLFKEDLYQKYSVKFYYYMDYNKLKHWS